MQLKDALSGLKNIEILGSVDKTIKNITSVHSAESEFLTWCSDKNLDKLSSLKNGTVIVSKNASNVKVDKSLTLILTDNPRRAFQQVLNQHFSSKIAPGISKTAQVSSGAFIGKNVFLGHNVIISDGCRIGDNSVIQHNTVLFEGTQVGQSVVIGANCTIGGIGFGYEKNDEGDFELIPHLSHVSIEDHVEIGNNTCIDRGVLEPTTLARNVKVDNLVHIAHGVRIGENSVVIANAMVAGSVSVGKNSWLAPSVSIKNGLKLGESSFVGLGAVVLKDVEGHTVVVGNPAKKLVKTK